MFKKKNIPNIGLIDPARWERAKWQATGFFSNEKFNDLPCFGFIFHNHRHGQNILVTFKSVYMRIFYHFFIARNTTVVSAYGAAEKFHVREWTPKKLVGAQGTFLR